MKNALRILVLASLTVSLSSCESIRSLFDVEIDTTIEGDLSFVTEKTGVPGLSWSGAPGKQVQFYGPGARPIPLGTAGL